MRRLGKLAVTCLLSGIAFVSIAQTESKDDLKIPLLQSGSAQMTSCNRAQNTFTRAHYKIIDLNLDFADKVIEQFLSYLDYNHSLLTKSEVDEIYANRDKILKALQYCDLSYPYELYNFALKRRSEKYRFYLAAVEKGLDVKSSRVLQYDRRKAPYSLDENALHSLWTDEVTNEYINQLLNKKTPKDAVKRLVKRYEAALLKLSQTTNEDAFSTYENAFATAIDPHTNYFSPVESQNFEDDINLSLEGIGAVLSSEDENTVIVSIIPGSPAEASKKLKPKDRIVGVRQEDGTYDDIIGWRLSDAVKKIKGRKGTSVTLEIERDEGGVSKSFSVTLVRDKIKLQDREAKGEVKISSDGSKIGVLTVKSFYNGLTKDMLREINKLGRENVKAVVVDLRNNGGGLLPEAVSSSGLFIKKGPIVQVRDALSNEIPQMDPDESIKYAGPLVVLINRLSASSSEIMAAALKDYGRAVIVGDTSFGKGTVQRSLPLARPYDITDQELGSINYTIAKFYRINGGSTQLKGVEPDLEMTQLVDDAEYGERNEENALPWDKIKAQDFEPYLNLGAYLPDLKRKHEARIKDNVEFSIFREDMKRYRELKDKNQVSLNLEERQMQQKEQDEYNLKAANTRLKIMGKPQIKDLKELPDGFEFDDPILEETLNIASDLANKISGLNVENKSNTPVLSRYAPPAQK